MSSGGELTAHRLGTIQRPKRDFDAFQRRRMEALQLFKGVPQGRVARQRKPAAQGRVAGRGNPAKAARPHCGDRPALLLSREPRRRIAGSPPIRTKRFRQISLFRATMMTSRSRRSCASTWSSAGPWVPQRQPPGRHRATREECRQLRQTCGSWTPDWRHEAALERGTTPALRPAERAALSAAAGFCPRAGRPRGSFCGSGNRNMHVGSISCCGRGKTCANLPRASLPWRKAPGRAAGVHGRRAPSGAHYHSSLAPICKYRCAPTPDTCPKARLPSCVLMLSRFM